MCIKKAEYVPNIHQASIQQQYHHNRKAYIQRNIKEKKIRQKKTGEIKRLCIYLKSFCCRTDRNIRRPNNKETEKIKFKKTS